MTFPRKVNLYEVGPRDGLQNEKEIIPIDVKVNLINKLIIYYLIYLKYLIIKRININFFTLLKI